MVTRRTAEPPRGLLGAGLVSLAAVCFGTLGPITRFADEAGVGSLALVAWRAGIGASVMLALLVVLHGLADRQPHRLRDVPPRERAFILAGGLANLVLNLAMFVAFLRIEIGLYAPLYFYPAIVGGIGPLVRRDGSASFDVTLGLSPSGSC